MALQRQTVEFPFQGGLDQETGKPHIPGVKLAAVTGAVQEKNGELRQTLDFAVQSASINGGGSLGAAADLQVHRGALIVRDDAGNLYSRASNKWTLINTQVAMQTAVDSIAHDRTFSTEQMDVARGGGYRAFIYRVNTKIFADVMDDTTGIVVVARHQLATGMVTVNAAPKVIATTSEFVFFWSVSGTPNSTLNAVKLPFSTPTTFGGTVAVSTVMVNDAVDVPRFDVMAGPTAGTLFIATYTATRTFDLRIFTTSSMTTTTGPTSYTMSLVTSLISTLEIAQWTYSDTRVYVVAGSDNDTRIEAFKINSSTLVLDTTNTVRTGVAPRNTASYLQVASTIVVFHEYDTTGAGVGTTAVGVSSRPFGGATTTMTLYSRAGLASKTWDNATVGFQVLLVYNPVNTVQAAYFLVSGSGLNGIATWFLPKNGGGILTGGLPHAVTNAAGGFLTVAQKAVEVEGGFTEFGMASLEANPATALNLGGWASSADMNVEPAGIVRSFDGHALTELNFHLFPEKPTLVESAGGSLTLLGTYNYKLIFGWMDRNQRLHRSEACPAVQIVLTGANNRVTLTISTLQFTNKQASASDVGNLGLVDVEVYRTVNGGAVYYKVGSVANNVAASTVSFVDSASDASITDNEPLYQQGGVLANQAPPAFLGATFWNGRFFGISAENPREIWYSKVVEPGLAIAFNDIFIAEADEELTGLAPMDDKLVAFGAGGIHILTGDGPDNLGNGVYATPFRLAHRVSLAFPRALAVHEQGIALRDEVGIQMLDRGLNLIDIGAPVMDETANIVQAQVVPGEQRIEWVTDDGRILVWDWYHQQWYIGWTGLLAAVAAAYVPGNDAVSFVGAAGSLLTPGNQYQASWTFTTAWIKLTGINGYERIKRAVLLGEFRARHTVAVTVYYDYDDATGETGHSIDTNTITPTPVVGQGVKVDIRPNREKCEAIKFKFTFTSTGGADETQRPWGLSFDIGVKPGLARYNTAARI